MTPKFKLVTLLNSINIFILFFKLNIFSGFLNLTNSNFLNFYFIFSKFFFSFYFLKLLKKSNQKFLSAYTNNFTLSLIFFNFKNMSLFFNGITKARNFLFFLGTIGVKDSLFLNTYFLSIRALKVTINKKFYKNLFFYLVLIWSPIWYQHNTFFKFYLNFILISYSSRLLKFYNGPFFKIYNF